MFLTCTAHGKPVWRAGRSPDLSATDLPDRCVAKPPPVRVLGPYEVGPGGYETVEEAVANDPRFYGLLDDPTTWFLNPEWAELYAHYGVYPGTFDIPVTLSCGCTSRWHEADYLHIGNYYWCEKHGDAAVSGIV